MCLEPQKRHKRGTSTQKVKLRILAWILVSKRPSRRSDMFP